MSNVLIHFNYLAFYILLFSSFLFLFFIELRSLCPAEAGGSSSALDSSQFHSITVKQTNTSKRNVDTKNVPIYLLRTIKHSYIKGCGNQHQWVSIKPYTPIGPPVPRYFTPHKTPQCVVLAMAD